MMQADLMMQAALAYAQRGLAVFPIHAGKKRPHTSHGFKEATKDEAVIRDWWRRWPDASVGIATGQTSGVYVLDVDVGDGKPGMESLAALEEKIGPIPRSHVVRTGSGGLHIYLATPEDEELVKSSAGKLGSGLDVRGEGGYVVAPPSIHPNGTRYAWERQSNAAFEFCPALVAAMLRTKGPARGRAPAFMGPGRRNNDLTSLAGFLRRRGMAEDELLASLLAQNSRNEHPLSAAEVERIARSIARYAEGELPEEPTDIFLAEWIAERIRGEFRVVGSTWMCWKAPVWAADEVGSAIQERIKAELKAYQALMPEGKNLGSATRIRNMISLVRSAGLLQSTPADFDADANLFNLANGVVKLDTGELVPHDPSFMLTKLAPVAYDPEAPSPRFDRFLEEVQPDEAVRRFLARLFGYIATGSVAEQRFCIFHGSGANGKTTLVEAIAEVLGDYADNAEASTFVKQKDDKIRSDLARLKGCRLVRTSELSRGDILDAALVKRFSGGDPITARHLYGREFVFNPRCTVVMTTNALPVIDGGDAAVARRLLLIPFGVNLRPEDMDAGLKAALRAEAPGILRWILEGLRDYREKGLAVPRSIEDASAEYVQNSDLIQTFLDEHYVASPDGKAPAGEMYTQYRLWCGRQGVKNLSNPLFKAGIEKKLAKQKVLDGKRYYPGVSLLPGIARFGC